MKLQKPGCVMTTPFGSAGDPRWQEEDAVWSILDAVQQRAVSG